MPLLHINTRSLPPKLSAIIDIIYLYSVDIQVILETWLRPDVPDSAIRIRDISLIRADCRRRKVTRGGVVAIYIEHYLSYKSV